MDVVNLYQAYSGSVILAGQDGGVIARRDVDQDSRFTIVARWDASALDGCLLRLTCLIVDLPVIVSSNNAISIVQLDRRILHGARDWLAIDLGRRTYAAKKDLPRVGAIDDEARDQDVVARLDGSARGDV